MSLSESMFLAERRGTNTDHNTYFPGLRINDLIRMACLAPHHGWYSASIVWCLESHTLPFFVASFPWLFPLGLAPSHSSSCSKASVPSTSRIQHGTLSGSYSLALSGILVSPRAPVLSLAVPNLLPRCLCAPALPFTWGWLPPLHQGTIHVPKAWPISTHPPPVTLLGMM